MSPLFLAAVSGNVEVVRALITEHKADVLSRTQAVNTTIGFDVGTTPLHAAMAASPARHAPMLEVMLASAGAGNINCQSKSGM